MLDRTIPPPIREISEFQLIQAQTVQLTSGVPVHVIDAGHHEIVLIECVFKSGKWYENLPGVSFFSSKMLLEGSKFMDSRQIADFFESHGARIEITAGSDLVLFSVYVLKKYFENVLPVLKDLFVHPVYPGEELEIMKEIQIQQIKVNNRKNNILAGKEFRKLIFGEDHPYGRALDIRDINMYATTNNLWNYYHSRLLSGMELILSGNLDSKIIDSLEVLSEVPHLQREESSIVYGNPEIREKRIKVSASLQTSVRYGRRIIQKNHEDYVGLVVLNELLGGYFGSRLMKNIREDKGYTYGIHSGLINHLHDGYWIIGTDVKREFTGQTLHEIQHEFARLRDEPVDPDELKMVRNYLLGNFLSSIETSFSLADKFKNIYFYNLGYSFYEDYLHALRSIDARRIQEIANRYLVDEEFSLVLVG